MCLSKLENFDVPNEGYGWKVLSVSMNSGEFYTPIKHTSDGNIIKSKFRSCHNCFGEIPTDYTDYRTEYKAGFHIFTTRASARAYLNNLYNKKTKRVFKVKYKNVLATGIQDAGLKNVKCFTAEFMRLA
jgi:hypothetical protein